MARKRKRMMPSPVAFEEMPPPPLARQSRYSGEPWKPGEIPADPFMGVNKPHDQKIVRYGGAFSVEKPTNRGKGKP